MIRLEPQSNINYFFISNRYGIPDDQASFGRKIAQVERELEEALNVVRITRNHIGMILDFFAQPRNAGGEYSRVEELRLTIIKEKTIYHNMNKLRLTGVMFHGKCWCPIDTAEKVKDSIHELMRQRPDIGACEFLPSHNVP